MRRRGISNVRIIVQATIFLLLGAIVNVAVAWGCVCWSETTKMVDRDSVTLEWPAEVSETWPKTARQHWYRGVGLVEISAHGDAPNPTDVWTIGTMQWVMRAGWPVHALSLNRNNGVVVSAMTVPRLRPRYFWEGLIIPEWIPWCGQETVRCLPTQPLWEASRLTHFSTR
jgi:hypothetical protein